MKPNICPECKSVWDREEIEENFCNACNYPYHEIDDEDDENEELDHPECPDCHITMNLTDEGNYPEYNNYYFECSKCGHTEAIP